MAYHELHVPKGACLTLDGERYDVDHFGMDDGRSADPDAALRFIFQLGQGYMIYLYVIQAGGARDPRWFFHTFWLKDCAVAEVDMEDRGPPAEVLTDPIALPLNYTSVTVAGRRFTIASQTFSSRPEPTMELTLDGATLRWTRSSAWTLSPHGEPARTLDELPRFGDGDLPL